MKNCQVSQRTKCINIHQHFVQDLMQQKKVIGQYVQSKWNMADSAMKNLPEKLFEQHVDLLKHGENLISQRKDVRDIRAPTVS